MKKIQKRIAMAMTILLVLPTIIGILPVNQQEVLAATTTYYAQWTYYAQIRTANEYGYYELSEPASKGIINVEKGASNFYIGDYVSFTTYDTLYYSIDNAVSLKSGVSYSSSNTGVAKVNSKGLVTTLKTGKTTLKVKFGGCMATCELNVVAKGKNGSTKSCYKKLNAAVIKLCKDCQLKITASNRYKVGNDLVAYDNSNNLEFSDPNYISYGFIKDVNAHKLVIAGDTRAILCKNMFVDYCDNLNPISSTPNAKQFKISSISAKKNTNAFTINLKSKVTSDQIFGINYSKCIDSYSKPLNSIKFDIWVMQVSTGYKYKAQVTATKGSNKLTVKIYNHKLAAGKTYKLCSYGWYVQNFENYSEKDTWTKDKTFKAK